MAKLVWAVTCQRILLDVATNSVSYIDAIEEMTAAMMPIQAQISLGLVWLRQTAGETIAVRVTGIDPHQARITLTEGQLADPNAMYHRANLALTIPLSVAGPYQIVVEQKVPEDVWQEEARIPLTVNLMLPSTDALPMSPV